MPETYWHLSRCDLFSRLGPDELRRMESVSRTRRFKRGEPVYLPADAADSLLLVISGRVKICHVTPEGKQSILVFVEPGEIFGELSTIDPATRQEYAEMAEAGQIVSVPRDQILHCMRYHLELMVGITKLIGLRRRRIERRLKNLLFRSNRERLVHLLLELLEQYGRPAEDGYDVGIKLSHQEMANIIGSTRETVTVVLGELQREGLVEISRRRVKILNLQALAGQVNETPRVPEGTPAPQPHLHKMSTVS